MKIAIDKSIVVLYNRSMENVINKFIEVAAGANDWKLILSYQWALNANQSSEIDLLDTLMIQKAKEN